MLSPRLEAVSRTLRRSAWIWSPASATVAQGFVAISRTDSMSSGLMSPSSRSAFAAPWSSSSDSIALTSAKLFASTIMSSSSTPTVKLGPVKF